MRRLDFDRNKPFLATARQLARDVGEFLHQFVPRAEDLLGLGEETVERFVGCVGESVGGEHA